MQLASPSPTGPPPDDLPTALRRAAAQAGQRPAVTLLTPRGRQEQGFASLAQWAAKGAHLLALDLLLVPGDRLRLDTPPSWQSAAVCLAAWWQGIEVVVGATAAATVAIVHQDRPVPDDVDEVLWLGDAHDGGLTRERPGEAWAQAVQAFPDQPPQPLGTARSPALRVGAATRSQAGVLADAAATGTGPAGIEVASGSLEAAPDTVVLARHVAVAVRPLVTLRPTVVLHDLPRETATGDRVATWLATDTA